MSEGRFLFSGCADAAVGEGFRKSDVGGGWEPLDLRSWFGNALACRSVAGDHGDRAEAGQLVESCFDGHVQCLPTASQFGDDTGRPTSPPARGRESGWPGERGWAALQMGRLGSSKGPFDLGEILVAIVDRPPVGSLGRQVGLEHVAAVELGKFGQIRVLLFDQFVHRHQLVTAPGRQPPFGFSKRRLTVTCKPPPVPLLMSRCGYKAWNKKWPMPTKRA